MTASLLTAVADSGVMYDAQCLCPQTATSPANAALNHLQARLRWLILALIALLPLTCAPPALAEDEGLISALQSRMDDDSRSSPGDTEVPVGDWPLQPTPQVVSPFDPPEVVWGAGHRGVDLLGMPGQVVRAALPGNVSFAGRIAGRGVVAVNHGPTRTTYEPVRSTVKVGDQVAMGSPIGILEPVGSHCLPASCLHWGWIRNSDDAYLDPLLLVGVRPVRLYPWDGR